MNRLSAIEDVRDYVLDLIEKSENAVEECKVRNESYEEEQEYLDTLNIIEDNLWHMI